MDSQHKSGWARCFRPLLWWLLFFLALYGFCLNQRLLQQTRLYFSISLNGQPLPYAVMATWDGRPINNGDKISLGWHCFEIKGPKTSSFATNLSIWYGKRDLGDIALARSTGILSVKADPSPSSISISGAEFSTNLQDSPGVELPVPTDSYNVSVQYRHWSDLRTVSVTEKSTSPVAFSPKFATVNVSCNLEGATFQIQNDSGQIQDDGSLPATITDWLFGNYHISVDYHGCALQKSVVIQPARTNDVPFQFVLGAAQLKTTPSGAQVHASNGDYLGLTPLLLPDMKPQAAAFSLSLPGYESVSVTMDIAADQTNFYSTNLVSVGYLSAIRDARTYLAASNYKAAAQAAGAALTAKPGDSDALAIQDEAGKYLDAERQQQERLQRPQKAFDELCSKSPYSDLFAEHELTTTKPAGDVAAAIVAVFTNSPNVFKILKTDSPEADTYEIVAKWTDFLGANERDCLIVVGSTGDADTQIRFKVLEFEVQHHLTGDNQLIPLSQSKVEGHDLLLSHVKEGLKTVTDKIRKGIGEGNF